MVSGALTAHFAGNQIFVDDCKGNVNGSQMKLSLLDFGFSLEEMLQNGVIQSSGWSIQQICSIAGCLLMWGWLWDAGIKSDPSHCIRACRSEGAVEAITHQSCRSWLVRCIVLILVPLTHGYSQPLLACTSKFTCDGIVQQLDNFKHILELIFLASGYLQGFFSWCRMLGGEMLVEWVMSFVKCVQAYQHASSVIQSLGELDINVNLLVQVDKLVRLLETPIFAYLRLQAWFDLEAVLCYPEFIHALLGLWVIAFLMQPSIWSL